MPAAKLQDSDSPSLEMMFDEKAVTFETNALPWKRPGSIEFSEMKLWLRGWALSYLAPVDKWLGMFNPL